MSYLSAEYNKFTDKVIVWERNEYGRQVKTYAASHYFYVDDEVGEYKSIFGQPISKYTYDNYDDCRAAACEFRSRGIKTYESDINAESRIIFEHYSKSIVPKSNITFYDIEVDYDPTIGFSSVNDPYAPISAIAIHHYWNDVSLVLAVLPKGWSASDIDKKLRAEHDIRFMKNEKELLEHFIKEIDNSDVVSGYNSESFDDPYVYKRALSVAGARTANKMGFSGARKPWIDQIMRFDKEQDVVRIGGRTYADYLLLFKKYEAENRQSYKLEAISEEILPHLVKLDYEGSLAQLYNQDFNHFLRYNIRDTEILKGFEDELGYVALSIEMYHSSLGFFKDVCGTLKLADCAIITYCHDVFDGKVPDRDNGNDVIDVASYQQADAEEPTDDIVEYINDSIGYDEEEANTRIEGGLVLDPQKGKHRWLGAVDIESLYPSVIRSINISPETLIGQFVDCEAAVSLIADASSEMLEFLVEGEIVPDERSATQWREYLEENSLVVSGYGTVFSQEKEGIIPSVLTHWFKKRKEYKSLMWKAQNLENESEGKAKYYNRLQYVYKIRLNSLYGALSNEYFRFYDQRLAASTTATGRMLLKHQSAAVNEILTGEYSFAGDAVIYGDTDSTYFKTYTDSKYDCMLVGDEVGYRVNDSFPKFMNTQFNCIGDFAKKIRTEREIIADSGIFVKKKHYLLHIVCQDDDTDVDKMKIMGLRLKKTTIPKPIAKKLITFVRDLLIEDSWSIFQNNLIDYKETLYLSENLLDIALPQGINKYDKYEEDFKKYGISVRLPGHVAASIHYNLMLDFYKDVESSRIFAGSKIRIFKLKTKHFDKFTSIAVPTDATQLPPWFIDNYLDQIYREAHIEQLIDKPLLPILESMSLSVPSKQQRHIGDILGI